MPIREMIWERHLKFTGDSIRMPNYEPIDYFVLYDSKGIISLTWRASVEKALEATEIWKIDVTNLRETNILSCLIRKRLRTYLDDIDDDDDNDRLKVIGFWLFFVIVMNNNFPPFYFKRMHRIIVHNVGFFKNFCSFTFLPRHSQAIFIL